MTLENSLSFLADLAKNNHRDWMDANKKRYHEARDEFKEFVGEVIGKVQEFDDKIAGLQPKDCIFRLNRDIRFSKDKSPYKTNFGASISSGGRKSPFAGYYLHVMPGNNFTGGGIYMPEADTVKKIRQEIDYNPKPLLDLMEQPDFKKTYGPMQGDALKTAPKGYPKDHPNIELLRHKSFYFMTNMPDAEMKSEKAVDLVIEKLKLLRPGIAYINMALD